VCFTIDILQDRTMRARRVASFAGRIQNCGVCIAASRNDDDYRTALRVVTLLIACGTNGQLSRERRPPAPSPLPFSPSLSLSFSGFSSFRLGSIGDDRGSRSRHAEMFGFREIAIRSARLRIGGITKTIAPQRGRSRGSSARSKSSQRQ